MQNKLQLQKSDKICILNLIINVKMLNYLYGITP